MWRGWIWVADDDDDDHARLQRHFRKFLPFPLPLLLYSLRFHLPGIPLPLFPVLPLCPPHRNTLKWVGGGGADADGVMYLVEKRSAERSGGSPNIVKVWRKIFSFGNFGKQKKIYFVQWNSIHRYFENTFQPGSNVFTYFK